MEERELLDSGLYDHESVLVEATKGKRFANYIIDYIMVLLLAIVLVAILVIAGLYDVNREYVLVDEILGILSYVFYYILMESALQGRTIGKLVTGTKAVREDGAELEFGQVVKRSLCRLVPFEPFSFLGNYATGWHDRWADTVVIDLKQSSL